jgi:hypothetical protein
MKKPKKSQAKLWQHYDQYIIDSKVYIIQWNAIYNITCYIPIQYSVDRIIRLGGFEYNIY